MDISMPGMLFTDISEKLVNQSTDQLSLGINSGNKLWYDLQPIVYLYCLNTIH